MLSVLNIFFILLGILCILYGLLVLSVGSGTMFFAVWLAGGVCSILVGLALRLRLHEKLPVPLRITIISIVAAAIVLFIAVEVRIAGAFRQEVPAGLDAIVVLGAQVRETGPSVVLQYRLDAAAEYLKQNETTLCVVSGGQGENEPFPEAVGMRDYLIAHGIGEERILLEDRSLNTQQNIQFSKELLYGKEFLHGKIGIVTNNFHLYRALKLAKKQELGEVYGIPAGCTPSFLPNNMLREFFGVLKDKLAGNI